MLRLKRSFKGLKIKKNRKIIISRGIKESEDAKMDEATKISPKYLSEWVVIRWILKGW